VSRDTNTCPICGASIYQEDYEAGGCEHCGATVTLCKIMDDILDEHYDELEAAGVNVISVNVNEPAVIPYLRSLWLENEKLKDANQKLSLAIRNIDSALRGAKGFVS
jgi:hypothetical protein